MQEVFEKIKEMLEETENRLLCDAGDIGCTLGIVNSMEYAIEIVNQVAEEYKECALCYFSNPCEYQNKDARMPESELNNGWFPCSERLPEDNEIHECTAQFNTGMRYIEYAYYDMAREEWWTHDDTGLVNVIAWKPSPQPYRGE